MGKIRLGIALDNILNERWNKEVVIIQNNIRTQKGITFTKTAFGKHEAQVKNVQELIDDHEINTLILVPVDGERAHEITKIAKEKNVSVILYSRPITKGKVDYVIKFDVIGIGESQAEFVVKNKKGPNTILIHGPKTDLNTLALLEGQLKVINPLINPGHINHIGDYFLDNWTKLKAEITVKKALEENKKVTIHNIIAANDMIAEAASEYVIKHNLPMPLITGLDAELNACKRIMNNTQSMSVALLPTTISQCVSDVICHINDSSFKIREKYEIETNFYGLHSHKSINTKCEVVTKDNLKEVVEREKLFPNNWI